MTYASLRSDPRVMLAGPTQFALRKSGLSLGPASSRLITQAVRADAPAPDGETVVISGIACLFDVVTDDIYGPRFLVKRGAFSRSLREKPDLPVLWNFSSATILGRTGAKTAVIWEGEDGLRYEVEPPSTQWASDLLISMSRRDVSSTAMAAIATKHHMETRNGIPVMVITEADLICCSVCAFPQFDTTIEIETTANAAAAANSRSDRQFLASVGIQSSKV